VPKSHSSLKASWQQEAMDRLQEALTKGTPPMLVAMHDPRDAGVFSVKLQGAVDLPEEHVLNSFVQDFREGDLLSARVDLRQVTFMDSTGLAFLVRLRRTALERGGEVTLVGASGICLRALQIVRFDTVFTMVP
jgi:anti-anti-sigma factor